MSDLATSAPTATMATGPERDSLLFSKFVTICCRPAHHAQQIMHIESAGWSPDVAAKVGQIVDVSSYNLSTHCHNGNWA